MTQPLGILNIDKPAGLSSRKVVDHVVRRVRPARAGHAGTLDPLARRAFKWRPQLSGFELAEGDFSGVAAEGFLLEEDEIGQVVDVSGMEGTDVG